MANDVTDLTEMPAAGGAAPTSAGFAKAIRFAQATNVAEAPGVDQPMGRASGPGISQTPGLTQTLWKVYLQESAAFATLARAAAEPDPGAEQAVAAYAAARRDFTECLAGEVRFAQTQARVPRAESERVLTTEAAVGASGDFAADTLALINTALNRGWDVGRALAFSLRDTPLTRELGELAMGFVAARRPLWQFASESYGACSPETLARYQLANAMHAFTVTGDARAAALARAGLAADLTQVSSWDLFRVAGHCAFLGLDAEFDGYLAALEARGVSRALGWRIENLALQRARLKAVARTLGCAGDDVGSVIAATRARPVPAQGARVQIGILSYANPTTPSTNIGDPIQTLGALGQLTAFDFADLEAPDGVADLLALGGRGRRAPIEQPARIVTVDRDYAVLQATEGRIWLPVCGWFTHEVHSGRYVFPLPSNILPIYMSLHIAQPEILTAEAIDHLKACAPIGCRDINTVRLLRNLGVPAFFNGCVTLTLDRLLTRHDPASEGVREGRYFADYNDGPDRRAGEEIMAHLDDEIVLGDYSETLAKAVGLLSRYRRAEAVRTPLLHCYLPCRALRTEVEFTNKTLSNPRFEGLIGIPEEEVVRIVGRFEAKYARIMAEILSGAEPEAVYALWREICAPDMAHTDAVLAARRAELAAAFPEATLDRAWLDAVPRRTLPARRAGEGTPIDVIFCFDERLAESFPPTLRSAVRASSRPIRAHLICRDLPEGYLERLARAFPEVDFRFYDVSGLAFGDVKLLAHTTISTMDRLVAPELMPDVGRAIYLDIDVLVRGDLAELADMDLGDADIAARDSMDNGWRNGLALLNSNVKGMDVERASAFREFFLSEGSALFEAFNAGVLVLDLGGLRASGFAARTFGLVSRHGVNDQVALNIYARERRRKLPPAWNHFASQEKLAAPKLVHFVGPYKPWHAGRYHPWFDEWRTHRAALTRF